MQTVRREEVRGGGGSKTVTRVNLNAFDNRAVIL